MSTEVQQITQDIIERHAQLQQLVPIDRQVSWLQLADAKSTILKQLTDQEIAIQAPLLNWETADVLALQTALQEYRKGVTAMSETRKGFTRYMDMITDEMMKPEKRASEWEVVGKAEARRISLLREKEEKEKASAAKTQELANFQAHVKNEYARMSGEYRQLLTQAITTYYKNALAMDLEPDGISEHLRMSKLALADIQVPAARKYEYKLHTKEEIIPHAQAIPQPDYLGILNQATSKLESTFSMYFNDKPKAASAIKYLEAEMVQENQQVAHEVQQQVAVNTLVASSAAFTISQPDGVKGLRKREVIVVKDDDFGWAHRVVTAFLQNWNKCLPNVAVKKAGNLSVAQMAAALDKAEVKVEGVEYKMEEK
jgi:hypothetical protein